MFLVKVYVYLILLIGLSDPTYASLLMNYPFHNSGWVFWQFSSEIFCFSPQVSFMTSSGNMQLSPHKEKKKRKEKCLERIHFDLGMEK